MKNEIKIAKELVKIAKNLVALDDEYDDAGIWHDPKAIYEKEMQQELDEAEKQGKKYILHHKEGNLWRIQACKNFGEIKKGDFGGLIESEDNLSHEGDCWVFEHAKVYEYAKVYDNARVLGVSNVSDKAKIYGNAKIFGNARIYGKAQVCGDARVLGNVMIFGDTTYIGGNAKVYHSVENKKITK